jgi:acetyl-CoA acetyltransferase
VSAICAIGCLTPHGVGTARLDDAIGRGAPCPMADGPPDVGAPAAGWLAAPAAPFAQRDARLRFARSSRLGQLALVAAVDAATRAAVRPEAERCAVVLGSACGAHLANELFYRGLLAGEASPRTFAQTLPSSATAELAIHLQLKGPLITLSQGSTSGLAALAEAADLLREGRATWALAGAAESLSATLLAAHRAGRAGTPLAEGACFFALSADDAGALGRIAGAATAMGDHALARARTATLERAGLAAGALHLELVFATAPAEDSPDAAQLRRVLGDALAALPVLGAAHAAISGQLPALVAAEDGDGVAAAICLA